MLPTLTVGTNPCTLYSPTALTSTNPFSLFIHYRDEWTFWSSLDRSVWTGGYGTVGPLFLLSC